MAASGPASGQLTAADLSGKYGVIQLRLTKTVPEAGGGVWIMGEIFQRVHRTVLAGCGKFAGAERCFLQEKGGPFTRQAGGW